MKLDQLAMAVASLALGTMRAIIAAGSTTPSASIFTARAWRRYSF